MLLQTHGQYKQKASVLLELLNAGPSGWEQQLAVVREHLDQGMLAMLARRIELALKMEQVGQEKYQGPRI